MHTVQQLINVGQSNAVRIGAAFNVKVSVYKLVYNLEVHLMGWMMDLVQMMLQQQVYTLQHVKIQLFMLLYFVIQELIK